MNLIPIRVTIGLDHKNHHDYPNFNALPAGVREHMDWCRFVDKYGGWLYDTKAGHSVDDPESPRGVWLGVLLVPELFAAEAADLWPDRIEVLDEAEAARFYEHRVTHAQPDVFDDVETLQAIAAKIQIGIELSEDDRKALDPDNDSKGRRRNTAKRFSEMITRRGVRIDSQSVARVKGKHSQAKQRASRG